MRRKRGSFEGGKLYGLTRWRKPIRVDATGHDARTRAVDERTSELTPERIFERWLWPLYPEDVRADLAKARETDANPAQNPSILARFDEIADTFVKLAPGVFGKDLELDRSDASVRRLGAALTRELRDEWAKQLGPDGAPLLSHIVIHGAIYVGACVVAQHGGVWRARRPLWESLVGLSSRAGEADLAIFQWWLKALSDAEIGRGTLADRYRMHVEVPCMRPEDLPVIAPPDRRLPRLVQVRYDMLYKHLRAHLPELRDVGEHFPPAERLAELDFRFLEFTWLGEGRMLLLHGPTPHGVHLFWLDSAGFVKSAFYPADKTAPYELSLDGEKLVLNVTVLGKPVRHELLWWGP